MRNAWPTQVALVAVAILAISGCNSSQPSGGVSRTASLSMTAIADGLLYDCYDIWVDTSQPPDGIPDSDTGYKICDITTDAAQRAVPWRYSLSISIIPAGSTTERIVTSVNGVTGSSIQPGDGIDDFISMTNYDLTVGVAAVKPPDLANGLYFINGKHVSVGSPVYLSANNFGNLGAPNVLTTSPSFDFTVNSGDTVVVRARKQPLAEAPGFITSEFPHLKIGAAFSVGGIAVVTNGNQTSGEEDKAGFTFSYTVQ
jgi:hypothetical protein